MEVIVAHFYIKYKMSAIRKERLTEEGGKQERKLATSFLATTDACVVVHCKIRNSCVTYLQWLVFLHSIKHLAFPSEKQRKKTSLEMCLDVIKKRIFIF